VTTLIYLLRRSKYHWLLILTLIFGVVLATAFLASGPILIDALIELGLQQTLLTADEKGDLLYLSIRELPDQENFQVIDRRVRDFMAEYLKPLEVDLIPAGHIGYMYPWESGKISSDYRLTMGFYGADTGELSEHIQFDTGGFPSSIRTTFDEIPVFISTFVADDLGVQVGDRFPVSISARSKQPERHLLVVGTITPVDYQDPYWLDHFNPFFPLESSGEIKYVAVFLPQESFFTAANHLYPTLSVDYSWQVNLPFDQITFEEIDHFQTLFSTTGSDAVQENEKLRVHTKLVEILNSYSEQASIVSAPLYFITGIVVLMGLYYLVMMSSLYLEQRRSEMAVMRSRGAAGSLLFRLELIEGMIFGGIALILGPLLAWLIVSWLALKGPLSDITTHNWGLTIPQAAWLAGGIAAAAGLTSLLTPLPSALKKTITSHQQSLARSGQPPLWQRYYLDVFAVAVGIILLYRVELYGSIIGGSAAEPRLDLMLILAPLSLLLGGGAIFLRIFPVFLQKSADLAGRLRGLPLLLALRQSARDPRHVTRLVLLLMLAMALGLFSTSFDATLTRNEEDRSFYYIGSDMRILANPSDISIDDLPINNDKSWGWRGDAGLISDDGLPGVNLLALNPDDFSSITRYRDDFSQIPVEQLLKNLETDWSENWIPLEGTQLPGQPEQIGLWFALPMSLYMEPERFDVAADTTFEVRISTAQGTQFSVTLKAENLGADPDAHWYYYQGDIPDLSLTDYPLNLISLWVQSTTLVLEQFDAIWIDDVSVVDHVGGNTSVFESFEYENALEWVSVTYPMNAYTIKANPHSGENSLSIYFDAVGISPLRWYGISRIDDADLQPIPALVSPDFIVQTGIEIGDNVRIKVKIPGGHEWDQITFKIIGLVDYFPTMYETEEAGFLVTLIDHLFEQINLYRYNPIEPNELLVASNDTEQISLSLMDSGLVGHRVLSAQSIIRELRANPLTIGLRSVTLFGYFLTTVLSVVGFGTHFYLSTQQRASSYSILRALGLSPRQLYLTLLVEQIILMLSGLAVGTILGLLLNQLILTGLPLRIGGLDTVPPFIVETDWILVFRVYLTLVISFLLALGIATIFLYRVRIHRVLRVTEE